ncbi:hypothetical protein R3P38DRAFT_3040097 [Favolaschia claudopus]|uniref:Uncharacterized protein n=1 Tax=Favolaschia claudopus TaxID=2862362 RepID=A0AAW0AAM4_9AGAR
MSLSSSVEYLAGVRASGESAMYVVFDLVAQTFVFGIYTLLLCLSTRVLLHRGLKSQTTRVAMLCLTIFMFLMSTAYWAFNNVYAADWIRFLLETPGQPFVDHDEISKWYPLFNAFVMINFVLSDCVVFWRAWVISHRNLRKYLWVTLALVVLTALAVFLTIAFRIVAYIQTPSKNLSKTNTYSIRTVIDVLQVSTGVFSFVSNLSATIIVAVTAVRHRQLVRHAFSDEEARRQSNRILGLVAEAGAFYCLSTIVLLIASFIRIPHGTLGDLYAPINLHIASAYPPAMILLVNSSHSSSRPANGTDFHVSDTFSARPSPLRFAVARSDTTTSSSRDSVDVRGVIHLHPPEKILRPANKEAEVPVSRFSTASL